MGEEEWQPEEPAPAQVAERPAYERDPWFYRIVVLSLGFAVAGSVVGVIILAGLGKAIPDALVALGAGAGGGLAGVFSVK